MASNILMSSDSIVPGCLTTGVMACGALATIVVSSLGLLQLSSMQAVAVTSLCTSILNPLTFLPQAIIAILGLKGMLSLGIVSGASLAFSTLTFMIGSVICGYHTVVIARALLHRDPDQQ